LEVVRLEIHIFKRFRFGSIEWYNRKAFFLTLSIGRTEVQFNRWAEMVDLGED
jgi:hypothetical protein